MLLMGIVNATGDSFSEGSDSAPASAVDRALALLDDGADLLDIGGESTRPGSFRVSAAEEMERIIPVIRELKRLRPGCVVSVDTRKSEVAKAALECGVEYINDVSMLRYSPDMAETVAASAASLIIGHSRATPQTMREHCNYSSGVAETVYRELAEAKAKAVAAGVKEGKIWVDPDFGFAKTPEQDFELLRKIGSFRSLGPVVAGVSRKSFLGNFTGQPDPLKRLGSTIAAALWAAGEQIEMLRLHDVRQVRDALRVTAHLRGEVRQ